MRKGFEFLDKKLLELYLEPDEKSDTGLVDKLVKVRLLNDREDGKDKEEWLLIHVEVQASGVNNFPKECRRALRQEERSKGEFL